MDTTKTYYVEESVFLFNINPERLLITVIDNVIGGTCRNYVGMINANLKLAVGDLYDALCYAYDNEDDTLIHMKQGDESFTITVTDNVKNLGGVEITIPICENICEISCKTLDLNNVSSDSDTASDDFTDIIPSNIEASPITENPATDLIESIMDRLSKCEENIDILLDKHTKDAQYFTDFANRME